MTRRDAPAERQDDAAWLDTLLRESRPPALDDAGFSAAVQVRIARLTATIAPAAALAAARRAAGRERQYTRWTIAGALVGALVAALAGRAAALASTIAPDAIATPGLALLLVSTVLAWLAISRS